MPDLSTQYLGLTLRNPLVASSCPLTFQLDQCRILEDSGIGAIIMPSLFEEKLRAEDESMHRFLDHQDIGHHEADSFLPEPLTYTSYLDEYLERLEQLKQALSIPVIASLNGVSEGGWVEHAKELEQAGADAIELNLYYLPANITESSAMVERRYINLVEKLRLQVAIPITLKMSSQFSAIGHLIKQMETIGVNGAVLFNRFYQPDINLETLAVEPKLQLSNSYESLLSIRWIAMLFGKVKLDLAATGGIHSAQDALKAYLSGASVTYLCSILLLHGPRYVETILQQLTQWLEEHEYESITQLRGSLCHQNAVNPEGYERTNYIEVLNSYTAAPGVWR